MAASAEGGWGGGAVLTGLVVEEEEEGGARHPPASAVMTLYQPAYNLHSRTLTYKVTLIPKDGGREGTIWRGVYQMRLCCLKHRRALTLKCLKNRGSLPRRRL